MTITLPEPEALDFTVDLDSLKFRALRTGNVTGIENVFGDETLKDKRQKEIKSSVDEFVCVVKNLAQRGPAGLLHIDQMHFRFL